MKIVLAGGHAETDFLVRMFSRSRHSLVVINADRDFCDFLCSAHGISVIQGDPTKAFVLDDAGITGADIVIALTPRDADNLVICQTAKRLFGVKRTIAVVSDPKNAGIFQKLGVNNAISASHLIAQTIERISIIEDLVRSVSLEDEKIVITEMKVGEGAVIAGKMLKDLGSTETFNISCIFRDPEVIIPKGSTEIHTGDRLLLVSASADQPEILKFLQRKAAHES